MGFKFQYCSDVAYDKNTGKGKLAQLMSTNSVGSGWFVFVGCRSVYSDSACTKKRFDIKALTYTSVKYVHKINGNFVLELYAGPETVYIKYAKYSVSQGRFNFADNSGPGNIAFVSLPKNLFSKSELNGNGCVGEYQLSLNDTKVNTAAISKDYKSNDSSIGTVGAATAAAIAATAAAAASTSASSSSSSSEDDDDPTNGKYAVEATNTKIWNAGEFLSNTNENSSGYKFKTYYDNAVGGVKYSNLRNIFGAPYQFLPSTDCRLSKGEGTASFITCKSNDAGALERAGYEFSEKIIARMPLLFITPGNTAFMGGTKKDQRAALLTSMKEAMGGLGEADETSLKAMLKDYSGKLYTILPAYAEYFNYVNPMCRAGAIFLGIADKELYGVKLDRFHWGNNEGPAYEFYEDTDSTLGEDGESAEEAEETQVPAQDTEKTEPKEPEEEDDEYYDKDDGEIFTNPESSWLSDFQNAIYYKNSIAFYINSEASFQESFTNETTESSLASVINGLSDKAREIQFLLGTASSAVGEAFERVDDTLSSVKDSINKIVNNISKGNSIFSTIANSVKTIVSGGRMLFPQIWANSTFSKSYNISIKLTTPSYDKLSWWLNIYVPLCHLAALVLPRSEYVNSYTTPFLVKAFYKGMFNIDMGIITEMSFNRGKEGSWTADGLPTVVDVSFSIQDLYSAMGMTSTGSMFKGFTLQNVAELDYLANLCGININQPDIVRMAHLWATFNITNKVYDFIPNLKLSVGSALRNKAIGLYNNFWGL